MKKCNYCGKEYPDAVVHCPIDNDLLAGDEPAASPADSEIQAEALVEPPPALVNVVEETAVPLSPKERRFRIAEVALVCAVAFGGSILSSFHILLEPDYQGSASGATGLSGGIYRWLYSSWHELTSLALLGYVLARRSKNFSSLGMRWAWKDFGWSILLFFAGGIAYSAAHHGLVYTGFTAISSGVASQRVSTLLFAGGVSIVTVVFQFLNPFFEELIVRGYLMTEVKELTGSMTKAVIASTVLQASYHLYQGVPLALSVGAMFLVFSIFYAKTKRLTPVVLAHLYMDVLATFWYALHA